MIRRPVLLLLALTVLAAPATAAADGVAECARYAVAFGKRQGSNIKTVEIIQDDTLVVNRFDDMVGSQRVATEYMGYARVTTGADAKNACALCACTLATARTQFISACSTTDRSHRRHVPVPPGVRSAGHCAIVGIKRNSLHPADLHRPVGDPFRAMTARTQSRHDIGPHPAFNIDLGSVEQPSAGCLDRVL